MRMQHKKRSKEKSRIFQNSLAVSGELKMARFSEEELDEIRRNTDIVTLIESYGTKLKQRPDQTNTLGYAHCTMTKTLAARQPSQRLMAMQRLRCEGDCFDWVMKAEKVSFLIRSNCSKPKPLASWQAMAPKPQFVRRLESPIVTTAEDQSYVPSGRVLPHHLKENPDAIEYLDSRGLDDAEAIAKFKIGFCDRTLGYRIPRTKTKPEKSNETRLESLGILKKTGHEAMRGCVTFPVLDRQQSR